MARLQRNAKGRIHHAKLPGPKAPSGLILGVFLAVIGGALVALGTLFPWVQFTQHVPIVNFKILDLIDANGAYVVMCLIPFSGILIACFSVVAVLGGTRGWGPGWLWPLATTISTAMATVVIALSLAWISSDYMARTIENVKFGSAAFIVAFGCVLAVAGSVIMLLGHRAHWETRQIVRPVRMKPTAPAKMRIKELPQEGPRLRERCPKCNSPVEADWRTCPICGEKL